MENAGRLLLYMLAYQLMHIARCILHSAPEQASETLEASTQASASVSDTQWSSLEEETSTETCTIADTDNPTQQMKPRPVRRSLTGIFAHSENKFCKLGRRLLVMDVTSDSVLPSPPLNLGNGSGNISES